MQSENTTEKVELCTDMYLYIDIDAILLLDNKNKYLENIISLSFLDSTN